MHKSQRVFNFGLLASSLVMLAIMPVLNQQNLFSNTVAMAQGYDAGYYGDSSYSKYPTDDKKYECRTGPFEGFFVSSVEFCKHVKFDDKDRKDHNRDSGTGPIDPVGSQGPAGPIGPVGSQGPAGPQGPAGSGNNNSTLVNTFNCINNNNININTDNNSSSSSNGLQPIQDTIAQGLNGTLDGLSLNKTIVNLCFINDNDNITIVDEGNETEPDLACEECFAANSTLQTAILDFLVDFNGTLIIGSPVGIIALGPGTDTIEQLCDIIESSASLYGLPMSDVLLKFFFSDILEVDPFTPESGIDALIECLLEAGIIVHRELPPPPSDSISANGIAGANSQCIGDPLCESLLQAQMTNSNSLGSSTNINTDTSEFQGTTDSSELTALEKIEKLKAQWLELYQ